MTATLEFSYLIGVSSTCMYSKISANEAPASDFLLMKHG